MADPTALDEGFVNTKDAAKLIGVSPATLVTWRNRKPDGPTFYSISPSLVVYKRIDLLAWVEQYRRISGVQIAPLAPGAEPRPWE